MKTRKIIIPIENKEINTETEVKGIPPPPPMFYNRKKSTVKCSNRIPKTFKSQKTLDKKSLKLESSFL